MANVVRGPLYININSTLFEVPYSSTNIDLSGAPTAMTTTNLSTALTGSTVLTAAVATVAEMNKTNAMVMEIRNALITFGLMSS